MPMAATASEDTLSAELYLDMSSSAASSSNNKSLRKREREKQRRSDLASAFDELSNLLTLVQGMNPAGAEQATERPSKKAKQEQDALTRFDLIGGTIQCIRSLHRENQQLKRQLTEAKQNRGTGGGNNCQGDANEEVLVMLPTLVPAEERSSSPRVATASVPAPSTAALGSHRRDYSNSNLHSQHPAWAAAGYAMQPSILAHAQQSTHAAYYAPQQQPPPPPQQQQGYGYYNPYYYMTQQQQQQDTQQQQQHHGVSNHGSSGDPQDD